MSRFKLSRNRGDTIRLLITATRDDAPLDLSTAAEITFTAKLKKSDDDAAPTTIQKTLGSGVELLDPTGGTAVVTLDPADTDALLKQTTYLCDVQLDEADGTRTTLAEGTLKLTLDVTRA